MAWEINRAAFKLAWLGLAWLGFSGGWSPPKHTPDPIAGILFVSVERWHCVYICGYKHDWAPPASNKDTVAMGSDGGLSYTWSP